MSLIPFPFQRNEYPGVGNPRFVSDIVAANQAVIDGIKAITGLSNTDFAIISGLDFVSGTPNSYTIGIFYLNGLFYSMDAPFSEGLYLAPNPTNIMPKPFEDGVSREIYKTYNGMATANPTGATPVFSGNMNAYRIGLKSLSGYIASIQSVISSLGAAAFSNIGNTPGTVAAGNDSRFGYSQATIDNLFARKLQVLLLDNVTPYTPVNPYNPATKAYADAASGEKLMWLGNISSDGLTISKLAGTLNVDQVDHLGAGGYRVYHHMGDTNYFVRGIGVDPANKTTSPRAIINGDSETFEVWVSDDASSNNANFQISIHQYF